jgi:glucose-6-phosphate dehydrogenase assembly protein OpcA
MEAAVSDVFDPAAIERRIDLMMKASGGATKRASLLTLVIVHPQELQAEVAARLDYVFGKRPLRVIRIETGGRAPTSVDVTARCLPHPTGEEVCFQEIVLYSGPDGRGLDPALWEPLVIRDLPAVLFSPQGLGALADLLERMDFLPDKCLVYSAPGQPAETLALLSRLASLAADGMVVADLAWRALTGVRLLTARLFDPEETRHLLRETVRIGVVGLVPRDALYLSLWLASRLGWKNGVLRENMMTFAVPQGGDVVLTWQAVAGDAFSLEFETSAGRASLKSINPSTVLLSAEGRESRESFAMAGCDRCLLEELDNLAPDRVFLDVLAAARVVRTE